MALGKFDGIADTALDKVEGIAVANIGKIGGVDVESGAAVPFETEWTVTDGQSVTLPLIQNRAEGALAYNCTVDWGDSTPTSSVTSYDDANRIHTYTSGGTYRIKITGTMEGWSFNNAGDTLKIVKIINWGGSGFNGFKYLKGGFHGCTNLTSLGTGSIPASGTGILTDGFANTSRAVRLLLSQLTYLIIIPPTHPLLQLSIAVLWLLFLTICLTPIHLLLPLLSVSGGVMLLLQFQQTCLNSIQLLWLGVGLVIPSRDVVQ